MGPIAGGYLCSTLGFEWAATVISFTGLFFVSFCFFHSQNVFKELQTAPELYSNIHDIYIYIYIYIYI